MPPPEPVFEAIVKVTLHAHDNVHAANKIQQVFQTSALQPWPPGSVDVLEVNRK